VALTVQERGDARDKTFRVGYGAIGLFEGDLFAGVDTVVANFLQLVALRKEGRTSPIDLGRVPSQPGEFRAHARMRLGDFAGVFENKALGRVKGGVICRTGSDFLQPDRDDFFASARSLRAFARYFWVSGFTGRGLRAAVRASIPCVPHRPQP
jgi:hypothetical protein